MKRAWFYPYVSLFGIVVGTASLVLCLAKGNQQILAWPIAVWLILFLWPHKSKRTRNVQQVNLRMLPIAACILAAASLILIAKAITARPEVSESGVLEALDEAERLFHQGKYVESLRDFENINVPSRVPLQKARKHHNCGVILIRLARYEEAVEHLRLSLYYDRSNVQAAYLLAVIAAEKGDLEKKQRMLDTALGIDPDYEPALQLRKETN